MEIQTNLEQLRVPLKFIDVKTFDQKELFDSVNIMLNFLFKNKNKAIGIAANQLKINIPIICFYANKKEEHIINPEIIYYSQEKQFSKESCLSIPGKEFEVERSLEIKVTGFRFNNKRKLEKFERSFVGNQAIVVQHEIDHINGILIMDKSK